jgi:hypothetical protein
MKNPILIILRVKRLSESMWMQAAVFIDEQYPGAVLVILVNGNKFH